MNSIIVNLTLKLMQNTMKLKIILLIFFPLNLYAQTLDTFNTWQEKSFVGNNRFSFTKGPNQILTIGSNKSASALYLKKQIDLNKTPILSWSWKISNTLNSAKETTKKGDDFSARVYVIASTGPFIWQTRTLAYVWSNSQDIGQSWPNPYTKKVQMLAVNSGSGLLDTWQFHRRNIQQDLQTAFKQKFDSISVLAVMTDTDNTQQKTTGWYKGFSFSEK
jgi:hypothetical protein